MLPLRAGRSWPEGELAAPPLLRRYGAVSRPDAQSPEVALAPLRINIRIAEHSGVSWGLLILNLAVHDLACFCECLIRAAACLGLGKP
jgi:hypothetical protein